MDYSTCRAHAGPTVETHAAVFQWVLKILQVGLIQGKKVGIDATSLEANAVLENTVYRETGQSYREYLQRFAKNAGLEIFTREQLAWPARTITVYICVAFAVSDVRPDAASFCLELERFFCGK